MSKAIASFLCGRHFLHQFSSREVARDVRADRGFIFHTQDRTTSCAICRRRFDRRRNWGACQSIGRTNAFRVTILPLPRANPPRARPATDPFGCSFFDAGEGILPHVLPARIT
jgi:hypothetical protein